MQDLWLPPSQLPLQLRPSRPQTGRELIAIDHFSCRTRDGVRISEAVSFCADDRGIRYSARGDTTIGIAFFWLTVRLSWSIIPKANLVIGFHQQTRRRDEHCSSSIRNECNLPQANPAGDRQRNACRGAAHVRRYRSLCVSRVVKLARVTEYDRLYGICGRQGAVPTGRKLS